MSMHGPVARRHFSRVQAATTFISAVLGLGIASIADAQTSVGSAFTYQGSLEATGQRVTGPMDLRFRLFDAAVNGTQIGSALDLGDVPVFDGVFSVQLDFGTAPFNGQSRWLDIQVRPGAGVGAYTQLAPRQPFNVTPYALFALNSATWETAGSAIANANNGFVGINRSDKVNNNEYFGIQIPAIGSNYGGMFIRTTSNDSKPFYGYNTNSHQAWTYLNGANGDWRVNIDNADRFTINAAGFVGIGTPSPQAALHVQSAGGEVILSNTSGTTAVPMLHFRNNTNFNDWVLRHEENKFNIATETTGSEKLTLTDAGRLGLGITDPNAKLHVINTTAEAVVFAATTGGGPAGVFNIASANNPNTALSAQTIGPAPAIEGLTGADASQDYISGVGGYSTGNNGIGMFGYVTGSGDGAVGVLGHTDGSGWAGFFEGDVGVAGTLSANSKQFVIDNPANPENEYLTHACIESDELKTMYDGVTTLDASGAASIALPDWFEKLNGDYRYQLTPIGAAMPNLYIASEITSGQFRIAGGVPARKVSWQVSARRIDPASRFAQFNVVRAKPESERGKYLIPAAYNQPPSNAVGRMRNPQPARASDESQRPRLLRPSETPAAFGNGLLGQ